MRKKRKYKLKYPFEGCGERFKTKNGMLIYRVTCDCDYSITEKKFEVGEILFVFGKISRKLYKMR